RGNTIVAATQDYRSNPLASCDGNRRRRTAHCWIPGERVGAGSLALMPAFCDLRFGSATQRPTSFSDHKVFVAAPRCPSNDAILCEYQINSSRKDAKHH